MFTLRESFCSIDLDSYSPNNIELNCQLDQKELQHLLVVMREERRALGEEKQRVNCLMQLVKKQGKEIQALKESNTALHDGE